MPKPTQTFLSVRGYSDIYILIKEWMSFGIYNLDAELLLVPFLTNSQVYEYYVGAFAKYIPTKGGEFFTPKSVVELMVDILEPYKGRVYDPCCGSGGMFVQCSKFVKEHQGLVDDISIFGQESNPGTWKMAKMNLAIRGLEGNLGERNGDSFTDDLHKNFYLFSSTKDELLAIKDKYKK